MHSPSMISILSRGKIYSFMYALCWNGGQGFHGESRVLSQYEDGLLPGAEFPIIKMRRKQDLLTFIMGIAMPVN